MKQYQAHTTDADGWEHHPAFAVATLHRITSTPGAVLFQSDVRHPEYMRVELHEATRKRDLNQDWVHPGRVLASFSMSMAQFASFVAGSGQGSGIPATVDWCDGDRPGLVLQSRLAMTTSEAEAAAHKAFDAIQAAEELYEAALERGAPAKERKELLRDLRVAIANATPNVDYAARKLTEHAAAVVEHSRADIEAMVASAQVRTLEIGAGS